MSYVLDALIARKAGLAGPATWLRHARMISLAQGLALIPLTNDLWDELAEQQPEARPDPHPEFCFPSAFVASRALEISRTTGIAYVEVELWGGVGTKAAIVWDGGQVDFGRVKVEEGEFSSPLDLHQNPVN